MIKYLLFDLDRTLWDFDGNALVTFQEMYALFELEQRCHVDFHTFHQFYFEVNDLLWEGYRNGTVSKEQLSINRFRLPLEHFGLRYCTPLAVQLSDYYVKEGPKQTGLMPGTRQLIEWLSRYPTAQSPRFQLGIVTNGFSEAQLPKMKTAGLYPYFQHFFLSEAIGYMKPDRRFFAAVQQALHAAPEEIMVVGDDFHVDIEGAQHAGMPQVYYNQSLRPLPKGAVPPTHEIHHLMEAQAILSQL